jgi:predicted alpha/beta superfamily hydrolase
VKPTAYPSFHLPSPETGTDYHIYIEAPSDAPANEPLPAILFMDGDDQFRYAVDAYHELVAASATPPLLLVGVGYGASYMKPANKRMRDYTPTAMPGEAGTGGADVFLRFLQNTLWSELARRYPLRNDARGIAGHSLGSLLALHALFQPKPFFNRALISSPSIWFDDRSILRLAAKLRDHQPALLARAFLSVGEMDTPSMTGDLTLLEQQLAARPFAELALTYRRYPDLDHYNVLPAAFAAGLTTLFR